MSRIRGSMMEMDKQQLIEFMAAHPLLTTAKAAEWLGITTRALEDRRRRGQPPPYVRISRSRVAYRLSDLHEFAAKNLWISTSQETTEV